MCLLAMNLFGERLFLTAAEWRGGTQLDTHSDVGRLAKVLTLLLAMQASLAAILLAVNDTYLKKILPCEDS